MRRLGVAVVAAGLLAGARCGRNDAELRLYNNGPTGLENLTLLFPKDEVRFGDVAVHSTTPYATVKHGGGEYAAFRFRFNGVPVQQNVIDFVG